MPVRFDAGGPSRATWRRFGSTANRAISNVGDASDRPSFTGPTTAARHRKRVTGADSFGARFREFMDFCSSAAGEPPGQVRNCPHLHTSAGSGGAARRLEPCLTDVHSGEYASWQYD